MKLIPVIFLKNNSIPLFIYNSFHCYFFEKKIYSHIKTNLPKSYTYNTIPYILYTKGKKYRQRNKIKILKDRKKERKKEKKVGVATLSFMCVDMLSSLSFQKLRATFQKGECNILKFACHFSKVNF